MIEKIIKLWAKLVGQEEPLPRRKWTPEEDAIITMESIVSLEERAKTICRTYEAVLQRRHRLKEAQKHEAV